MTDDLPAEVRRQDEEDELQIAAQLAELRKEEQGPIGQVAAEVQQGATVGRGRAGIGPELLEPRLEDG